MSVKTRGFNGKRTENQMEGGLHLVIRRQPAPWRIHGFMANPWPETGMCLEQGLGLTDIPRGCLGRRPGPESSVIPHLRINSYYSKLNKINPSPGIRPTRLSLVPKLLRRTWGGRPGLSFKQLFPFFLGVVLLRICGGFFG